MTQIKRNSHVSTKILVWTLLPLTIIFSALIVVVVSLITRTMQNTAQNQSALLATCHKSQYAGYINELFDYSSGAATMLARSVELPSEQFSPLIAGMMEDIVRKNDHLRGAVIALEPNANPELGAFYYEVHQEGDELKNSTKRAYDAYRDTDPYRTVIGTSAPFVTEPAVYTGAGAQENDLRVTFCLPLLQNGKAVGVLMTDISLGFVAGLKYDNGGYKGMSLALVTSGGTTVYNSFKPDKAGKAYFDGSDVSMKPLFTNQPVSIERKGDVDKLITSVTPMEFGNNAAVWYIVTNVKQAEVMATSNRLVVIMGLVALAGLAVIGLFITYAVRRIMRPIGGVVTAARELSHGRLDIRVDNLHGSDEIAQLADAFGQTTIALKSYIGEIGDILSQMAEGNLNLQTAMDYEGDFVVIRDSLRHILDQFNEVLSQLNRCAVQIADDSGQVSYAAQALSHGATEQASAVEQLMSTIADISGNIRHNAENAGLASTQVSAVGDEIMRSNQQMQQMTSAMVEISNASSQIGLIIKTIEDISFQTNILALNAAVEAARAGTAGKGFAVVADEVRNLATKSANAAKTTTALIEDAIKAVQHGAAIADETAATLLGAVESVKQTVKTVDSISQTTKEQALAISQVSLGVEQISSVVHTNSATAQQSASASEELSAEAQVLKNLAEKFRLRNDFERDCETV